jgi:hypothetical protein
MAITGDDIQKASEGYEILGPAYFAARRIAETVMVGSDEHPFQEVANKAAELVLEKLYDYVQTHLLSDVECNIQGHLSRLVDDTVEALLTGQPWALQRYPLAHRYDGERVRAAIFEHAGPEMVNARVADLEKEVAQLKESLKWERECRSRF